MCVHTQRKDECRTCVIFDFCIVSTENGWKDRVHRGRKYGIETRFSLWIARCDSTGQARNTTYNFLMACSAKIEQRVGKLEKISESALKSPGDSSVAMAIHSSSGNFWKNDMDGK